MKFLYVLLFFIFPMMTFAQETKKTDSFQKHIHRGDSAFKAKNYPLCGTEYELALEYGEADFIHFFRATKCFALSKQFDKSFKYLNKSVETNWQFTCEWFEKDEKLQGLKNDPRWNDVINKCDKIKLNFNVELRDELLTLRNQYQELRSETPAKNDKKYQAYSLHVLDFNKKSTARMKEIITEHGWPDNSLVGEVGAHAAWLLIQHSDTDPIFQEKCLNLLKEAYQKGEASGSNYAFLYDRVMVNKGEKQLFGTQVRLNNETKLYEFQPIEKEEDLNKRRSEVGLQWTGEEYAYIIGFTYKSKTKEAVYKRNQEEKNYYESLIKEANSFLLEKKYEEAVTNFKAAFTLNGQVKTEDFIDGAKALIKVKKPDNSLVFLWLKKAVARGWKDVDSLRKSKTMRTIQKDKSWEILKEMIEG